MTLLPVLLLLVLIGLAALAMLLLVSGVLGRSSAGSPPGTLADSTRRVLAWRLAGLLVGGLAAYAAVQLDGLGRGLLLAAPIFGLGVLGGALLGEVTFPGPGGGIRRAQLRTRRAVDYLPRLLGPVVLAAAVVLFAVSGVTTALASADDQGRSRALQCTYDESTVVKLPFPGTFYAVPALAAVLAGLVLAALVLRRIARRPQLVERAAADDALRRRSAEAVAAATGVLVLVPLVGFALTAATGLTELGPMCDRAGWTVLGYALFATAGLAALTACWCAAVLLMPSRSTVGAGVLAGEAAAK
ncbi:hypothetical protein ACWKSP_08180 [Micromonosporaceae bacterium Da 78-11]